MCCTALRRRVLNFKKNKGWVGDDFVIKTKVGQGQRGEGSKSWSKKRT